MLISRVPNNHEIELEGELLEQVDSYKYLGLMIKSNGSLKEKMNQRIGKEKKVV